MGMRETFTAGTAALFLLAAPAGAVDIQDVTSPGGVNFWLVEEPSIPIVAVEISFDGAARLDPEGKGGLANMFAGLLEEGSGDLDAIAFANARDALSALYGFDAGRDSVEVSARMLVENLDASAELLATALAEPRFDEEPLERVRGQILSGIASDETDPDAIASKLWFARAFPDHPYGRPTEGTAESVASITREDLAAQLPTLLNRSNATVAVVGAVDADRAAAMVDTILGGLPEGAPHEAEPAPMPPPAGVEIEELDVPQSVAVFGQSGIAREDPDFIPAYVMNHILGGGGFTSRLMVEVREKRGLAYGVYSFPVGLEGADLFFGNVQTANERIGESLDVIRAEWARMAEEGVSADELDKAKRYLTGAFPLRFDSNAKIARFLVGTQQEELGIDYINIRNDLIEAVTVEDIKRVAARLLKPGELSVVVVGKPVGL